MKSKVVEDADVVTYVVVCGPGHEAVGVLNQFGVALIDLDQSQA